MQENWILWHNQPWGCHLEGHKVVTSEEMARIEKGGDHEKFMETAGRRVAEKTIEFIEAHHLPKQVTLLIGKGNNGGDAYAAGLWLLEEGYQVTALSLYDDVSPLNQKFREKYRKKRGRFGGEMKGVIIDGLLGTGFKGKVEKKMASIIKQANDSGLPIIAIDIPSGLSGTTGEVGGIAIIATETVALGLPKIGFFIHEGWKYVGKLHVADFGLSREAIAAADAVAYLPKRLELPKVERVRHKYQAGYVVGYAGSKALSGAAKMTGFSALKAGAGIVRIFHPEDIGPAPLELICNDWNPKAWKEALKKANAVFIGPGLGPCKEWLKKHLKEIKQPCVIDADALLPDVAYPKKAVLTPHRGEVLRLLDLKNAPKDEELFAKVIRFCESKKVYVVLKGAPTVIFGPKHKPIFIPRGDPGMASAGTGDVLTGMIAGLLAQGCDPYEAALLGATLHAIAGEFAASALTSYCLTATDLIDFMPVAFQDVLLGHDIV
ncbi:MAG: NAD(P)H-hydrate dehydratase [Parachlamydiales bacterium]|nr:NAD(P)H-hydrate dehydratase [Parachlamydiales bacterium]